VNVSVSTSNGLYSLMPSSPSAPKRGGLPTAVVEAEEELDYK
jgi:hypothetical protein